MITRKRIKEIFVHAKRSSGPSGKAMSQLTVHFRRLSNVYARRSNPILKTRAILLPFEEKATFYGRNENSACFYTILQGNREDTANAPSRFYFMQVDRASSPIGRLSAPGQDEAGSVLAQAGYQTGC